MKDSRVVKLSIARGSREVIRRRCREDGVSGYMVGCRASVLQNGIELGGERWQWLSNVGIRTWEASLSLFTVTRSSPLRLPILLIKMSNFNWITTPSPSQHPQWVSLQTQSVQTYLKACRGVKAWKATPVQQVLGCQCVPSKANSHRQMHRHTVLVTCIHSFTYS